MQNDWNNIAVGVVVFVALTCLFLIALAQFMNALVNWKRGFMARHKGKDYERFSEPQWDEQPTWSIDDVQYYEQTEVDVPAKLPQSRRHR